jgi:hypothetical protein
MLRHHPILLAGQSADALLYNKAFDLNGRKCITSRHLARPRTWNIREGIVW